MANTSVIWDIDAAAQTSRLIHGNLRFLSDDVDLASIVASAGWNTDHLHRRGDIIGTQGRRATRHYAATETFTWSADEELSAWLMNMAGDICQHDCLASQLACGIIKGTIWLALFGDDGQFSPILNPTAMEKIETCNIDVLFENYTEFDDAGRPRKTWMSRNASTAE